jgi:hypothetical protein
MPKQQTDILRNSANRIACAAIALASFVAPANAQVVIPYGDFGNDTEKYFVAVISLTLLGFAVWRYYKGNR